MIRKGSINTAIITVFFGTVGWVCPLVGNNLPVRAGGGELVVVTNLAGRVMSGELVAVTAREVRLRSAAGMERNIPLRALPVAERARLRRLAGVPEPADPVQTQLERELAGKLKRIDAREAAGQLTPVEAAQRRAEARKWMHLKQQQHKRQLKPKAT